LRDFDLASGEFLRIHVRDADFGVSCADFDGEENVYRYGHGQDLVEGIVDVLWFVVSDGVYTLRICDHDYNYANSEAGKVGALGRGGLSKFAHFTNNIDTPGTSRYKVCFGVILRLEGGEEVVPSFRLDVESFGGVDV